MSAANSRSAVQSACAQQGGETPSPSPERHWAFYIRVSTQEQSKEGVSLDAQLEKCRVALQLESDCGTIPVKIYREEGESGKSLERTRMLELLRNVELGRVHGIICFSLDRLSRSIKDFCHVFDLCEKHDTRIISVSQKFDTSTPVGKLSLRMVMCFAEFERDQIVDRITTAVNHLRINGYWTGGRVPFGYDLARDAQRRSVLVQNATQAPIVRKIFELVRETRSLAATVRVLRRQGITRSSGQDFDMATLDRIIQNRTYVGEVAYRITKKENGRGVVTVEWAKGRHEPIVSQELFDAMATIVYRRTKEETGSKKTTRVFPLQGLLYCSHCRTAFTPCYTHHKGRNQPFTFYYRCLGPTKRTQEQARCPFYNLNAEKMEQQVIRVISAMADDRSGWLDEICQNIRANGGTAVAHLEVERQAISREKSEAKKELDNAIAFVKKAGAKAPAYLASEINKLERKVTALETELEEKERTLHAAAPVKAEPAQLRALFKRLGELLARMNPAEQQELLRLFIQKIDITRDGLVLHIYEPPEDSGSHELCKDQSSKTSLEWYTREDSNLRPQPSQGCALSS